MALRRVPARERRRRAGWLYDGNSTALERAVVDLAFDDLGTVEAPPGSNRGPRIDEWLRRARVPESLITSGKGWWCAAWLGHVLADAGLLVPEDYASCDAWLPYLTAQPRTVCVVLYGLRKAGRADAHHIGLRIREAPLVLTIEGNRAFAGTTNNGVAVDLGPMLRRDVLGYVHLSALAPDP